MAQKRHMLVLAHTGRQDALVAASAVCDQLVNAGLTPVVAPEQADAFRSHFTGDLSLLGTEVDPADVELTIVLAAMALSSLPLSSPEGPVRPFSESTTVTWGFSQRAKKMIWRGRLRRLWPGSMTSRSVLLSMLWCSEMAPRSIEVLL